MTSLLFPRANFCENEQKLTRPYLSNSSGDGQMAQLGELLVVLQKTQVQFPMTQMGS